jgi:hypothetical protein
MNISIEFNFRDKPPTWVELRRSQFHKDKLAEGNGKTHKENCEESGVFLRLRDYEATFAQIVHSNCILAGLLPSRGNRVPPNRARIYWSDKSNSSQVST